VSAAVEFRAAPLQPVVGGVPVSDEEVVRVGSEVEVEVEAVVSVGGPG
tara:strand:+ start:1375 stop:1518 length:144 start_codon:yes stop_codon:yes gene_type:complete